MTGCTGGIGKAYVHGLAAKGMDIVLVIFLSLEGFSWTTMMIVAVEHCPSEILIYIFRDSGVDY